MPRGVTGLLVSHTTLGPGVVPYRGAVRSPTGCGCSRTYARSCGRARVPFVLAGRPDRSAARLLGYPRRVPAGLARAGSPRREYPVGPWYTLVDEWLVAGEAIVRNLHEGRRRWPSMDRTTALATCPMFGHISQMPAILNGFGIDNAFLSRGLGDGPVAGPEFFWVAPGGAEGARHAPARRLRQRARIDAERHLRGPGGEPDWRRPFAAGCPHRARRASCC